MNKIRRRTNDTNQFTNSYKIRATPKNLRRSIIIERRVNNVQFIVRERS